MASINKPCGQKTPTKGNVLYSLVPKESESTVPDCLSNLIPSDL